MSASAEFRDVDLRRSWAVTSVERKALHDLDLLCYNVWGRVRHFWKAVVFAVCVYVCVRARAFDESTVIEFHDFSSQTISRPVFFSRH